MKDLHIILMDNRRSEMAADPQFKQALQCIRCASCLNVCPVFRLVGGHVFGKIYTGGIGTILTAWFDELKKSADIQSLCIQCGNCVEVCPAKIDIPGLILELRRRLVQEEGQSLREKGGLYGGEQPAALPLHAAGGIAGPETLRTRRLHSPPADVPLRSHRFPQPSCHRRDALPRPLRQWGRSTTCPGRSWPAPLKAVFYAGCLIDFAYPEMGEAVVKILNKAGIQVIFPEAQTCCGAPARYSGAYEVAAQNAIDNIKALLAEDADYVVSACPTCTVALKREFAATLESLGMTAMLPQAAELAAKTIDFSSLVKRLVDERRLTLSGDGPQACRATGLRPVSTITYHDSCHLKKTLKVFEEPRELLRKAGYEITEMFESDICCGMGGSYSLKLPEISAPILDRKLKNLRDTGAPVVAMDCPGCAMQIRGGLDKAGTPIQVRHTAELLADLFE